MGKMMWCLLAVAGMAGLSCQANAQYGNYDSRNRQSAVVGTYEFSGSRNGSQGSLGSSGMGYRYRYGDSRLNDSPYGSGSSGGYGYRYRVPRSNQGYYPGYYNLYGNRAIGTMYQY